MIAMAATALLGPAYQIASQLLSMLPYLATILVLTLISAGSWRDRLDAPACLGKPFRPAI